MKNEDQSPPFIPQANPDETEQAASWAVEQKTREDWSPPETWTRPEEEEYFCYEI